ncbi:MAG: hypothetical protein KAH33_00680 [Candidatus Delongbacteria bacterium]|nr:hypothetical protein [Candidatus Delongbacteria bacterium]
MIFRQVKFLLACVLFVFLSCEDRIFLEQEPELILENGVYILDSESFPFDHVILEKDSMLYTSIPCNQDSLIAFFNIDHSGTYLMSLILDRDTLFRKSVYLNEIHNEVMKITVLDVKQGDCFIIFPSNEKPSIIDGGFGSLGWEEWQGGGDPILVDHLIDSGNTSLRYLIETHYHKDHYGGLSDVVSNGSFSYDKYITNNDSVDIPAINDTLFFSDDIFGIMLHYGDLPDSSSVDENNRSITLKLVYKDFEMLFTGDIEEEAEEYLLQQDYFIQDQNYDVLKVPHHGSSSSSTQAFLEQVSPKLSVISAGEGNDYGHPTEAVLERLRNNSRTILRTDKNGTINIFTDGISLQTMSKR